MDFKLIWFISILFLHSSCLKELTYDYDNCLPELQIDSIKQSGDSLWVFASITKPGLGELEYGFSYSNQSPDFEFTENQFIPIFIRPYSPQMQGPFELLIPGVSAGETYYFKVFAVNNCGYTISPVREYTVAVD